jgi:hypothetical protein
MGVKAKTGPLDPGKPASAALVDPHLRLASAIMVKAYADLTSDDGRDALDALWWLGSPVAELFADCLALDHPLQPIQSGRFTKAAGGRPGGWRFRKVTVSR